MNEELQQLKQRLAALEAEVTVLKLSRAARAWRRVQASRRAVTAFVLCFAAIPLALHAFTTPNTFTAGTPAVAADVNANFTAIKNQFDAMENKSWRLIHETDVSSATNQIDITGLDGNVDAQYAMRLKLISGNAAGGGYYSVQPNADATGANYGTKQMGGNANASNVQISTSATPLSGLYVGYTAGLNHVAVSELSNYAKTGSVRVFFISLANGISGTSVGDSIVSGISVWNNTGSNINSFRLVSQNANGIGVGSHIEVWARR
ncbi:MAG: hypothetical protein U1F27_11095 [Turneriella sp.]